MYAFQIQSVKLFVNCNNHYNFIVELHLNYFALYCVMILTLIPNEYHKYLKQFYYLLLLQREILHSILFRFVFFHLVLLFFGIYVYFFLFLPTYIYSYDFFVTNMFFSVSFVFSLFHKSQIQYWYIYSFIKCLP